MSTQRQHVALFRKVLLRKRLCSKALPGAVYVPFLGDGDLAVECYQGRKVYGADLDAARVANARTRLPGAMLRVADCDGWPFPGVAAPFAVADFDAYAYPYHSFRAFWEHAAKLRRMVLFFTDGNGQAILRSGYSTLPDGTKLIRAELLLRRKLFNFWLSKQCLPWIAAAVRPYRIVQKM